MKNLFWNFVGRALLPALFFLWIAAFLSYAVTGSPITALLRQTCSFDTAVAQVVIIVGSWFLGPLCFYQTVKIALDLVEAKVAVKATAKRFILINLFATVATVADALLQPKSWPRGIIGLAYFVAMILADLVGCYWGSGNDSQTAKSPRIR